MDELICLNFKLIKTFIKKKNSTWPVLLSMKLSYFKKNNNDLNAARKENCFTFKLKVESNKHKSQ